MVAESCSGVTGQAYRRTRPSSSRYPATGTSRGPVPYSDVMAQVGPDPAPDMAQLAEGFVAAAESSAREWHFDFTPPSVLELDELVETLRGEPDFDDATAPWAAAYFGEVAIRNGAGRWVPNQHGWWAPGVQGSTGFVWYPVQAVHQRAHDPESRPLSEVYSHAMAGAPVPARGDPAPRFGTDLQRSMWSWAVQYAAHSSIWGRRLTWDLPSLDLVDEACTTYREEDPDEDMIEVLALGVGAYVGEVIRATAGGTWRTNEEEGQVALKISQWLETFPVGKVHKRLTEGEEHDLRSYVEVMLTLAENQNAGRW